MYIRSPNGTANAGSSSRWGIVTFQHASFTHESEVWPTCLMSLVPVTSVPGMTRLLNQIDNIELVTCQHCLQETCVSLAG